MSEFFTKWHAVALAGSLAMHLGIFSALSSVKVTERSGWGSAVVDFEVQPSPSPAPVPDSVEPPEPEAEEADLPSAPVLPVEQPAAQDSPEPELELADSEEPVELTGVTLTNDGAGDGWVSRVGNGSALRGPIRAPSRRVRSAASRKPSLRPASLQRSFASARPDLVPLTDLSRRPSPPPLDGKLASNYPPEARRRGLEGLAVVTARIEADGHIRVASIASESDPGFGEACRRTIVGSVWSPPQDASGRAVATQIRYTCQFRVDR